MSNALPARFPDYGWAWPKGGRDLLLRAAILDDLHSAGQAFGAWLDGHVFNDVTFAEQRLLVAISARLPDTALSGSVRARLKGIERMLWTHSTLALQAARPALQVLGDAGIAVMVLKGAARAAIDLRDVRGRFASDVDLLVPRPHFETAYLKLRSGDWHHNQRGEPNLARITGINLYRGTHGDLDLHKFPLHQLNLGDADQSPLWERATQCSFLGLRVSVPSPTDRLLMAIAHGGIDGHQHSDWLVDCAVLMGSNTIDWPLFERLCAERQLEAHAGLALSYLVDVLDAKMPPDAMARIQVAGKSSTRQLWSALLQAHPKREHNTLGALGRGLARGHRQVRKALTLARLERRADVDQFTVASRRDES